MAKIMLVDDSRLARNLLRAILENNGYIVCGEASNGRKGVEKYRKLKPDLVFCDLMMNEMDGLECMRTILKEDPEAKVVICTSAGDELHSREALSSGAKGFLVKPINASEAVQLAEKLIGKPVPASQKTYKELMEERAISAGVDGKPLLDFFEAFRKLNGFGLDDARVNEQYLRDNIAGWTIGVRALLTAKTAAAQVDQVMDIFQNLV